jgi:hypothetical protein
MHPPRATTPLALIALLLSLEVLSAGIQPAGADPDPTALPTALPLLPIPLPPLVSPRPTTTASVAPTDPPLATGTLPTAATPQPVPVPPPAVTLPPPSVDPTTTLPPERPAPRASSARSGSDPPAPQIVDGHVPGTTATLQAVSMTDRPHLGAVPRVLVVPKPAPVPPRRPDPYATPPSGSLLLGFMETIGISLVAGAGFALFQARRLRLI